MQFSTIFTRVEDISGVSNKRNLIKDAIRWGLNALSNSWMWSYLMQEAFITTIAPHSTGNITVTNGSATINGGATSPVFTVAMVGRKIRIADQQAYYRIKTFVTSTQITLEVPYQGSTLTDQDYSIFKDEYRLVPDCDRYKIMRQIEEGVALTDINPDTFDLLEPMPKAEGSPHFSLMVGTKLDTYTTGTISATANTKVITGVNTVWSTLEGLGRMSKISISGRSFTVKSVDSDTQITVYENIATIINALTTYIIILDNLVIQFFEIPDSAENVYYRHQRLPVPLESDEDIPDMPNQWDFLLVNAGLSVVWKTKDREEAVREEARFFAGIRQMIVKLGYIGQNTIYPRKSMVHDMLPTGVKYPSPYGTPFSG